MPQFDYESTIQASAVQVFDWHLDPAAVERLIPPWEPVTVVGTPARIDENGSRTTLRICLLGIFPIYWEAEHQNYHIGKSFQDIQIKGPFARWCHTHSVDPIDDNSCRYIDHIDYDLPIGALGELLGGWVVRKKLKKMFTYRHKVVKEDCEKLAVSKSNENYG